jgi:hypothetical protein
VKDGVRCELVKLHTINKEKPMKELVGRKRKAAEEEGKEHYPITARGLRDPLGARELDGVTTGDEAVCPGLLHLLLHDGRGHPASRRGGFSLAMAFLVARSFTRMYQSALGGYAREEKETEIDNGGGGGEKELVNSTNPPLLLREGTWAKMWRKERKRQPTDGQRNIKITALPMKRYALSKDDV